MAQGHLDSCIQCPVRGPQQKRRAPPSSPLSVIWPTSSPIQEERIVSRDKPLRYEGRILQIPEHTHRQHFVKATVRVLEYPDGRLAIFHGPRLLARYQADAALQTNTGRETQTSYRLSPPGGRPSIRGQARGGHYPCYKIRTSVLVIDTDGAALLKKHHNGGIEE